MHHRILYYCSMKNKQYQPKTPATIDWQELINEAINVPGGLSKIFSRFYNYSYGNQLLLWCQDVREPVATYRRWQEMGRQVKKGAKAKMIVRPVPVYGKNEQGEKEQKFVAFKPINSVFPLSDTEGEELQKPTETPRWDANMACENLLITKQDFDKTNGNIQGYAQKRSLAINPLAAFPLETMAHELAHIVLGHTEKLIAHDRKSEQDIIEFQAEAVSFIIMNESEAVDGQDWDRSGSRAYIQHWLQGKNPSEAEIKPIFSAVEKILKAGKPIQQGAQ